MKDVVEIKNKASEIKKVYVKWPLLNIKHPRFSVNMTAWRTTNEVGMASGICSLKMEATNSLLWALSSTLCDSGRAQGWSSVRGGAAGG